MPNPGLPNEKTAAIQGRILAGEKPINIALAEEVSYSSVMRAKAKIPEDVLAKMDTEQIGVIEDLIMLQLETGIEASVAIAVQAQDEDWRKSQNAAQLATFYGVITDKSIRLLEASENAARAKASVDATGEGSAYSN
jgi:hypothetical protein